MMGHKQLSGALFAIAIIIACALCIIAWPQTAQAGSGLPPREPSFPNQPGDSGKDDRSERGDKPVGAYIELHVSPAQGELWAGVQWQDRSGNWHDVEGWQGVLNTGGYQQWWVAGQDFGTGPFRWVISQESGGLLLTTTPSFTLPGQANETIRIEVSP